LSQLLFSWNWKNKNIDGNKIYFCQSSLQIKNNLWNCLLFMHNYLLCSSLPHTNILSNLRHNSKMQRILKTLDKPHLLLTYCSFQKFQSSIQKLSTTLLATHAHMISTLCNNLEPSNLSHFTTKTSPINTQIRWQESFFQISHMKKKKVHTLQYMLKHKIQDQIPMITNFDGHQNLTCYYFVMSIFELITYPTSHKCFFINFLQVLDWFLL
jgi:hypothetical protein